MTNSARSLFRGDVRRLAAVQIHVVTVPRADDSGPFALAVRRPAVGLVVPSVFGWQAGQHAPGVAADAGVNTFVVGQAVDDDVVLRTGDPLFCTLRAVSAGDLAFIGSFRQVADTTPGAIVIANAERLDPADDSFE